MVSRSFSHFSNENKNAVETQLYQYVEVLECPAVLREAMLYSLQAGGKRIRPLLLFATLEAFGKDSKLGIPTACALEMIHTYSLIHDDLPCMDDDDLRRGKPTNHKVFGEDMATLSGDALLTFAFEVVSFKNHPEISDAQKIRLIGELAKAAGPEGMVAGQVADMQGEGKQLEETQLQYIHKNKTGKLLTFPVVAGAIIAGIPEDKIQILSNFGALLGLAFQIQDDILDVEGTEEEIGKRVGSDETNEKSTYVSLHSLTGAKDILKETIQKAKGELSLVGIEQSFLLDICDLIQNRTN